MLSTRKNRMTAMRGFSLVEVIAATVLLAVGIAAGMGALSKMVGADTRVGELETMSRLAQTKFDELIATEQATSSTEGTFEDIGENKYKWSLEITPSGITNLDTVRLTVKPSQDSTTAPNAQVCSLIYRVPTSTAGAG